MFNINYNIITTEIKDFTYRTPLIVIDENGEPLVEYSRKSPSHVKKITLLGLVGRNDSGVIVSYDPMDYVNIFLMSHHIDHGKQESDQYSKGLVNFFSFLIEQQRMWDNEYDEDLFDELVDLPRPTWNYFGFRKSQKITYQYREALKKSVLSGEGLARTTAIAYMRAVVKFYSFHIRQGCEFNNQPFEHELITINYQASGTSMKAYMSKQVHTTDLRLNFPKSQRNQGGSLPSSRRDLMPLPNSTWKAIENILLNTKQVIKNVKGEMKTTSLANEYCLFFLICRFTGLRKEEVASLTLGQLVKPTGDKKMFRIGVGAEYGSLTKDKDGDNKSRKTIIPAATMQMLWNYSRSDRYQKRLAKFKELCKNKRDSGEDAYFASEDGVDESKKYLFISATGKPFFTKLNDLNARWGEIRNTIEHVQGIKTDAVIHSLRPSFAVALFRALLKKTDVDTALAYVSGCLGHSDLDITLLYLKIAQDDPTGDEIFEDVLDYIGVFDDIEADELTHGGSSNDNR